MTNTNTIQPNTSSGKQFFLSGGRGHINAAENSARNNSLSAIKFLWGEEMPLDYSVISKELDYFPGTFDFIFPIYGGTGVLGISKDIPELKKKEPQLFQFLCKACSLETTEPIRLHPKVEALWKKHSVMPLAMGLRCLELGKAVWNSYEASLNPVQPTDELPATNFNA